MIPSLRSAAWRASGPRLAGILIVVSLLGIPGPAPAQQAPRVSLLLSDRPADAAPKKPVDPPRLNYLRPNVPQELFLYVKNDDDEDHEVIVQVVASGVMVAEKKVTVVAEKVTPVAWAPAAPGGVLADLKGPVAFRILDAKRKALGKMFPCGSTSRPLSSILRRSRSTPTRQARTSWSWSSAPGPASSRGRLAGWNWCCARIASPLWFPGN